jgi:hypothetical protein
MALAISWDDRQAADRRQSLRTYVKLYQSLREHLPAMAVDPSLAEVFRRGEEKVAELAAIPDTPELERADAAIVRTEFSNSDGGAQFFRDKLARMVGL